jgi:hypothetical protein
MDLHSLQFTTACTKVFSGIYVFTSPLVTASNGGSFPSFGFLNELFFVLWTWHMYIFGAYGGIDD